jgi:hypothetical protein
MHNTSMKIARTEPTTVIAIFGASPLLSASRVGSLSWSAEIVPAHFGELSGTRVTKAGGGGGAPQL